MLNHAHAASLLGTLILALAAAWPAHASETRFAVYGDMPYMATLPDGRTDKQVLEQDIAPRVAGMAEVDFVIHLGDLGRPKDACNDTWLHAQKKLWEHGFKKPAFYTPGDNDWTDCDRATVKPRQSELARLDAVRRVFFSTPHNYDPAWRYSRQHGQPENASWTIGEIHFTTLHIVSTDNGREQVYLDDPRQALSLADSRDAANLLWLKRAFKAAKNPEIQALVIATQHDFFEPLKHGSSQLGWCLSNPSFAPICEKFLQGTKTLGKPVLMMHGDTDAYCLDQPFKTEGVANFWRLNAPGDFKPIDLSIISVDVANKSHPFSATSLLAGGPVPDECVYEGVKP
jgi:hypothetical protein